MGSSIRCARRTAPAKKLDGAPAPPAIRIASGSPIHSGSRWSGAPKRSVDRHLQLRGRKARSSETPHRAPLVSRVARSLPSDCPVPINSATAGLSASMSVSSVRLHPDDSRNSALVPGGRDPFPRTYEVLSPHVAEEAVIGASRSPGSKSNERLTFGLAVTLPRHFTGRDLEHDHRDRPLRRRAPRSGQASTKSTRRKSCAQGVRGRVGSSWKERRRGPECRGSGPGGAGAVCIGAGPAPDPRAACRPARPARRGRGVSRQGRRRGVHPGLGGLGIRGNHEQGYRIRNVTPIPRVCLNCPACRTAAVRKPDTSSSVGAAGSAKTGFTLLSYWS